MVSTDAVYLEDLDALSRQGWPPNDELREVKISTRGRQFPDFKLSTLSQARLIYLKVLVTTCGH